MIDLLNKCIGMSGLIVHYDHFYFRRNFIVIQSATTLTNRTLSSFGSVIEYNGPAPIIYSE